MLRAAGRPFPRSQHAGRHTGRPELEPDRGCCMYGSTLLNVYRILPAGTLTGLFECLSHHTPSDGQLLAFPVSAADTCLSFGPGAASALYIVSRTEHV